MPKTKKKSPNVPNQYLGYSLQATRFLMKLLNSEPGCTVSLEVFEDVGTESKEGYKTSSQTKSSHDKNPISDRAVDLWKAFSNWIDAVNNGTLDINKTIFEIYVSKPVTGEIVENFSKATSDDDSLNAFKMAKEKLWGKEPDYNLKASVADSIKPFLENVFNCNEKIIGAIIKKFSFICGSGSPQTDLIPIFERQLGIPTDILEDVINWSEGWVKRKTDLLIEKGQPAYIKYDEFKIEIVSFIRKNDCQTILASFAPNPTPTEITNELNRLKIYIQQINLIDGDYEDKITAVNEYLRASTDRTIWGQRGIVHSSSFDDLEDSLKKTWKNFKGKLNISASKNNDIEKGKLLYFDCMGYEAKLQGLAVPPYFTPGSFHALSDSQDIGWHPNYPEELKKLKNGAKTE